MKKPSLGAAAPVEESPVARYRLPSGDVAELEMPDFWSILGAFELVPDPLTAAVIKLLKVEGSYTPEADANYYRNTADEQRGLYSLYAICRKDKTLDLTRKRGDGDKVLGRLDVPWRDLEHIYYAFFLSGSAIPISDVPLAADIDGTAQPSPDSGDVSPTTE